MKETKLFYSRVLRGILNTREKDLSREAGEMLAGEDLNGKAVLDLAERMAKRSWKVRNYKWKKIRI